MSYFNRVAVAGGTFIAISLWESIRARRTLDKFAIEKANPQDTLVSFGDYLEARREASQGQGKLLDVKNFNMDNLEVRYMRISYGTS